MCVGLILIESRHTTNCTNTFSFMFRVFATPEYIPVIVPPAVRVNKTWPPKASETYKTSKEKSFLSLDSILVLALKHFIAY